MKNETKKTLLQVNDTNETYHSNKLLGTSTTVAGYDPLSRSINLAKVKSYMDKVSAPDNALQKIFDLGSIVHEAILEQTTENVRVLPDFESVPNVTKKEQDEAWLVANPKANKKDMPKHSPIKGTTIKSQVDAWKLKNPAKYYVKSSEYEGINGMFDVFASHDVASRLVSNATHVEASFYDEAEGMKCRPDLVGENDKGGLFVCNYKTIVSLDKCSNHIFFHSYDIRAAQEIKIIERALGKPVTEYVFLFQEKSAPYSMRYIRLSEQDIEAAKVEHTRIFNTVITAIESDHFPQPVLKIEESSVNRSTDNEFLSGVAS